jgi:8-oxo-dGTP pyrophosphatase MutT (NUDIX family)
VSTRSVFGPDWTPGPDGLLRRDAARVLVLDHRDRLLLVRGHDVDRPERSWWFTVGGGIDEGETPRHAAVRELEEETGVRVAPEDLIGPVLTRAAVFDFDRRSVRQDEQFFLVRVPVQEDLVTSRWTAIERDVLDELRWWDLDALAAVEIEIFPACLVDVVKELLGGWDGVVRHWPDGP